MFCGALEYSQNRLQQCNADHNTQLRCLRNKTSVTILSNAEENLGFESNWKREEMDWI